MVTLCLASGLIEISTVERGVVSLYGVKSELFVAMNSRGRLYGTVGMHSILFIVQQCWLNGSPGNRHALCSGSITHIFGDGEVGVVVVVERQAAHYALRNPYI